MATSQFSAIELVKLIVIGCTEAVVLIVGNTVNDIGIKGSKNPSSVLIFNAKAAELSVISVDLLAGSALQS